MTSLNRRHFVLGAAVALAAARTPGWTEQAVAAVPNLTLLDLLATIPADLFDLSTSSGQTAAFADVAGQLKAVGVSAPADHTANGAAVRGFSQATQGLVGPDALRYAMQPDWVSTFGFEVFDIDQSLEISAAPMFLTVYRGRFKPAQIDAALKAGGYVSVDRPGAAVWSLSEDESIDLQKPANKLVLARMNNVALVAEDVLMAAPRLDALLSMLDALAGSKMPVAANAGVTSLLARLPDLSTCLIVGGDVITGQPGPVKLMISGLTYGASSAAAGPSSASRPVVPLASWNTALLADSAATASGLEASIPSKLDSGESLVTKMPYKEFFSDWKIAAYPSEAIVTVEISFSSGLPAAWSRFIYQRDLGFLTVS